MEGSVTSLSPEISQRIINLITTKHVINQDSVLLLLHDGAVIIILLIS